MARSRGAKKGYEAESLAKLFVPQAASVEQARGSHQYRAIHRDCEQEPELASRWLSLGYRKVQRLVLLHFRHEDYRHWLRLRRHSSCCRLEQLDYLHRRVRKIGCSFPQ